MRERNPENDSREIVMLINRLRAVISANSNVGNDLNEYAECVRRTGLSIVNMIREEAVQHCTLALNGEAGEVANLIKKIYSGKYYYLSRSKVLDESSFKNRIKDELGDVMWYLTALILLNDMSVSEVLCHNAEKVLKRNRETLTRKIISLKKAISR